MLLRPWFLGTGGTEGGGGGVRLCDWDRDDGGCDQDCGGREGLVVGD